MIGRKVWSLCAIISCIIILSWYFQFQYTLGPVLLTEKSYEDQLMELMARKDFIYARNLRNECNRGFSDDIDRFTNSSCRAELTYRVRSNVGNGIQSVWMFDDHWTEQASIAIELEIARNLTIYFKPCANIPHDESIGHQILKDQMAPIFSTHIDPRYVHNFLRDRKAWRNTFEDIASSCRLEKLSSSQTPSTVPGCALYVTESLLAWNKENYGIGIEHLLPLLSCNNDPPHAEH